MEDEKPTEVKAEVNTPAPQNEAPKEAVSEKPTLDKGAQADTTAEEPKNQQNRNRSEKKAQSDNSAKEAQGQQQSGGGEQNSAQSQKPRRRRKKKKKGGGNQHHNHQQAKRKRDPVLAEVEDRFAACGRCCYFLGGYRSVYGKDAVITAVLNQKDNWLTLNWGQSIRELMNKTYGVRIDVDYYHYEGCCEFCQRPFAFQAGDGEEKVDSFRIQM